MRNPFRRAPRVPAERVAIGNFQLSSQLAGSSGRSMTVSGYVYSDDDEAALNDRLDLYQRVTDRQRTISEIPELEAAREQKIKALDQAREVLAELEERQKAGSSLSSQERMNMKNLGVSISKVREDIDKGEQLIREARLKVGMG